MPYITIGLFDLTLFRLAMCDFEELLMHGLRVVQAREMLRRNMSTMLTHVSFVDTKSPKANLLDIIRYLAVDLFWHFKSNQLQIFSDVPSMRQSMAAIKFTSGGLHYVHDSVNFVQILGYKSIDLKRILDDSALPQSVFEQDRGAEVLIVYRNEHSAQEDDITRTVLHCKRLLSLHSDLMKH